MKKIPQLIILIYIFLILIVPVFSFAQTGGLVPCDNVTTTCDFNQFLNLIDGIIKFIIKDLAIPIAAVMFAYAGFLMITGGGEAAHARTKAKNIFTNAVIGLVIAAGAWLIVTTLLVVLGYKGSVFW